MKDNLTKSQPLDLTQAAVSLHSEELNEAPTNLNDTESALNHDKSVSDNMRDSNIYNESQTQQCKGIEEYQYDARARHAAKTHDKNITESDNSSQKVTSADKPATVPSDTAAAAAITIAREEVSVQDTFTFSLLRGAVDAGHS